MTAIATPAVWTRSNGVPEWGAATTSHHRESVGATP